MELGTIGRRWKLGSFCNSFKFGKDAPVNAAETHFVAKGLIIPRWTPTNASKGKLPRMSLLYLRRRCSKAGAGESISISSMAVS